MKTFALFATIAAISCAAIVVIRAPSQGYIGCIDGMVVIRNIVFDGTNDVDWLKICNKR